MDSLRIKAGVFAIAVLALDQFSKIWLLSYLVEQGGWKKLTSYFNLVMVWNSGISFGMFQSGETGRWLLVGFSSLVCLGLCIWLWRQKRSWPVYALALVVGGAVGNIVDRVTSGAVADFFDFHVLGYHWPAFNISDSAITIGIVMLLYDSFWPIGGVSNKVSTQDLSKDV